MTVYIFTGPTLSAAEVRGELDAICLPPVSQGDVYRAALRQPRAIGIIDGYFERVPAVWHKEILWAMSEGIHVFGSASMGALRAAELAPFGMEGIGAIFAAYRDGILEDDDEVAVVHGPAEHAYPVFSVAMVNIRATLQQATARGIIGAETHALLLDVAKRLWYPDRSYARILDQAAAHGPPGAELEALRAWLPDHQVDQKREDARAMLRVMRERLAAGLAPKCVRFHFEHTLFWEQARRGSGELILDGDEAHMLIFDRLLDELRLEPGAYRQARQAALLRTLARALSGQRDRGVPADVLRETIEIFRRAHGLLQPEATGAWLGERGLSQAAFRRLMEDEALLRWAERWALPFLADGLADELRLNGSYAGLSARARDKRRALEALGWADPDIADLNLTQEALARWYFTERLGVEAPADLAHYAVEAGFADEPALLRCLLREFCYARAVDQPGGLGIGY